MPHENPRLSQKAFFRAISGARLPEFLLQCMARARPGNAGKTGWKGGKTWGKRRESREKPEENRGGIKLKMMANVGMLALEDKTNFLMARNGTKSPDGDLKG